MTTTPNELTDEWRGRRGQALDEIRAKVKDITDVNQAMDEIDKALLMYEGEVRDKIFHIIANELANK